MPSQHRLKPRYEVYLRLHEDDATGYWGLCHDNAVGVFNAFWGADGIFHDVFEHYFEGLHPYFSGRYMHTLYGEMAASGAAIALAEYGINNFRYRRGWSAGARDFTADTAYSVQEWLADGEADFPIDHDLCKVPYQRNPDSRAMDHALLEYQDKLEQWYERCGKERKVSWAHIRNCYYWGYHRVDKLGLDRDLCHDNLDQFLVYWNIIDKANPRELSIDHEDAYAPRGFRFKVFDNFKTSVVVVDELRREFPLELLNY